jgi:outer membrane protein OmpA-like peptidoglycan-associated protein
MIPRSSLLLLFASGVLLQGQAPNPVQQQVTPVNANQGTMPVFRVTVVSRTTPAINYRHRGGATKIDFKGTALLPESYGEAKVESKRGYIEIEVEFDRLEPATKFGPEYLTYVLWAITPEGRATNLGELLLDGDKEGKLNVTTELQSFGLVVTAEPYFAVTQPSDVVVMENVIRDDTRGKFQVVDAKYELLKRGQYTMNAGANGAAAQVLDKKVPLELHEARNAVQLARYAGADRYAGETFRNAESQLRQAEDYLARKQNRKTITMAAREAVQTAEDARLIAIQKQEQERLAQERQAAAERERIASAKAAEEQARRREAEFAAERTARQKAEAEAARAEAERARVEAAAEAQRLALEKQQAAADAERARAQAAAEAQRLEQQRAEAAAVAQRAEQERLAAEAARTAAENARAAALAQQQAAQQEAERARLAAEAATRERDEMRTRLQQQLNLVLETRESARGLIVNMSDVLFDVDKHTLRAGAREKLAKVAGILLAYPGLNIAVEGHTDSTGSDGYNQSLSERRAASVRDYLVSQSIAPANVTARGFGETMPVVSNDSAAGRQQNRRVELVVSGEMIGGSQSPSQ